jgi:hypothetical protein
MDMRKMATASEKIQEDVDVEKTAGDAHLHNETINTLYWDKVSVKIQDKKLRREKLLLDGIDGTASAGQSIG